MRFERDRGCARSRRRGGVSRAWTLPSGPPAAANVGGRSDPGFGSGEPYDPAGRIGPTVVGSNDFALTSRRCDRWISSCEPVPHDGILPASPRRAVSGRLLQRGSRPTVPLGPVAAPDVTVLPPKPKGPNRAPLGAGRGWRGASAGDAPRRSGGWSLAEGDRHSRGRPVDRHRARRRGVRRARRARAVAVGPVRQVHRDGRPGAGVGVRPDRDLPTRVRR
jgi:hypothetical protein